MFSDKFKARMAGLALAGAAAALMPAAASAGVVVKSSGPSSSTYPVGRQVADTATVTLKAGDRITVLTDSGTRVMQGPGTFRVGEGATRTQARFSNLTRRNASRARTGAVRGSGPAVARSPNLWFVNVAAAGNICLYDLETVRLWRPVASDAQTFTIMDQTSQTTLDVNFVETESVRALDTEGLPLSNGASYTITPMPTPSGEEEASGEGEASEETPTAPTSVNVTFVALSEIPDAPDQLAQTLIANGCTTQLALLADTLEASVRR